MFLGIIDYKFSFLSTDFLNGTVMRVLLLFDRPYMNNLSVPLTRVPDMNIEVRWHIKNVLVRIKTSGFFISILINHGLVKQLHQYRQHCASFSLHCCFWYGDRYPRYQIHISLGMSKYFHGILAGSWNSLRNGQSAKALCFILPFLPNTCQNMTESVTSVSKGHE